MPPNALTLVGATADVPGGPVSWPGGSVVLTGGGTITVSGGASVLSGNNLALVSSVPEPSTYLSMLFGMFMLIGRRFGPLAVARTVAAEVRSLT